MKHDPLPFLPTMKKVSQARIIWKICINDNRLSFIYKHYIYDLTPSPLLHGKAINDNLMAQSLILVQSVACLKQEDGKTTTPLLFSLLSSDVYSQIISIWILL
jgi:hypothetical protein